MFRVVPDQLRISEGWVRCGQCDEVFDANSHLRDLAELKQGPSASDEVPAMEEIRAAPDTAESAQAYDWGPMLVQTASQPLPPIQFGDTPASPDADAVPNPDTADMGAPLDEPPSDVQEDAFLAQNPHDLPVAEESLATQLASAQDDDWLHAAPMTQVGDAGLANDALAMDALDAPASSSVQPPLSFMPRSQAPSRHWLGSKALLALCLVCALVLGVQWGLSQRNNLAASVPALRPVLVSACELLDCTISAPRQIESIAIESSAFTNVKPGVYLLALSLKNAAAMELEAPALELSLTDLQDQTLLRRVITAGEFASSPSIAAGAELSASLPLRLKTDALGNSISGYKLLAFYP
jgi:predicted Zn finger-like uncharacterized protein